MLKSELGPSVEASDLSAKERSDRKMQQTRYQKDFKDAMAAFQDVRVCRCSRGRWEGRGRWIMRRRR
jgi:hypothetical protein